MYLDLSYNCKGKLISNNRYLGSSNFSITVTFLAVGVTIALPQGTGWKAVEGTSLVQLEAGPEGKVWGVNAGNEIYRRSGVTSAMPMGISWMKVGGPPSKFITVGKDQLYSIDLSNMVYSGTLTRTGGAQKLPGIRLYFIEVSW